MSSPPVNCVTVVWLMSSEIPVLVVTAPELPAKPPCACVKVIACAPSASVGTAETLILPLCPFACSIAALSCTKNAFWLTAVPVKSILTATPPSSSAPAVPAPVSVLPESLRSVPVTVEPSLSASVITYLLVVPSVEVMVMCSFSVIPLAASPSATVTLAVACCAIGAWPNSQLYVNSLMPLTLASSFSSSPPHRALPL